MDRGPSKGREVEQRLAALERELDAADVDARASRWRRSELVGQARREPEGDGVGGLGFVLGIGLALFGLYAFFSNVVVTSGLFGLLGWGAWGAGGFGPTLLLLMAGVVVIAVRPRAVWGWGTVALALGFIFFEVLGTLRLFFRPISLPGLIIIVLPLALGIGLMLRSVAASFRRP